MALYGADLALVQAAAFGDLARSAAPEIVARLKAAPLPVRRVYDVGCGAGVTTRALTDAGFDTIAVEPSPDLLAIARAAAPAARFVNASAYDVAFETCAAVLAVGEVLTYHAPDADAEAAVRGFFDRAARALVPGGLLAFDVIEAEGPPLDARSYRSTDDWAILYETREDRPAARLTRAIETFVRDESGLYRRAREVHHVKTFDVNAMKRWLEEAGFRVETARAYGFAPLAPRRVAFFATRA